MSFVKKIMDLIDLNDEVLHTTANDTVSDEDKKVLADCGVEYTPNEESAGGTFKRVEPLKDYFKPEEFACKCCGKGGVNSKLHKALNKARAIAGLPFVISSGYRCAKNNKAAGGSDTSSHLKRWAVDIKCANDKRPMTSGERYAVLGALFAAGINRVGVAKNFIHADMDPNKPAELVWLY